MGGPDATPDLWKQPFSAVRASGGYPGNGSMAPFNSKASTACWRSWWPFLVRKLMHWWVSWGLWWKVMPTPSSTMPVARQVPSRLLHCGAKSARWAPTWTPSTPPGWGSWRSLLSLAALIWVGSMVGSPAGASTKGLFLCHISLYSSGCRGTKTIKDGCPGLVLPGGWCHFCACLGLFGFLNKSHGWACHILSACRMALTLFCRSLGSGPRTWEPSNGAVLTVLKTWGWKPNFLSKASLHRSWRLDAAANPAETAETLASWIMVKFSSNNLDLWSFGDSSSITDTTIESASEA